MVAPPAGSVGLAAVHHTPAERVAPDYGVSARPAIAALVHAVELQLDAAEKAASNVFGGARPRYRRGLPS